MPASTLAASASTRRSIFLSGAPSAASTCQPSSRVQFCHWTASALSISAMAGAFCCAKAVQAHRLTAHTRANPLDQLFDVIRFLDGGHGDDVAIVLLQVEFQLLR